MAESKFSNSESKFSEGRLPLLTAAADESKSNEKAAAAAESKTSAEAEAEKAAAAAEASQRAVREHPSYRGKLKATAEQQLLHRAIGAVYQKLLHGLDTFVEAHFGSFLVPPGVKEHRLEWTQLHQDFERLVEVALEAFCETEGLTVREFSSRVSEAADDERGQKMVGLLLGASSYTKFVKLLKGKSRRRAKKDLVDGLTQDAGAIALARAAAQKK